MNQGGEGDGEQGQADSAQPEVRDAVVEEEEGQAQAGEEEDGENSLADGKEELVGDECAGRAAEVLDGGIGVDLMAGPVVGVETGHGDQQKAPGTERDKENDAANHVGSGHSFFLRCNWEAPLHKSDGGGGAA